MDPHLQSILKESKNYDAWLAVADNRTKDAIKYLGGQPERKNNIINLFTRKPKVPSPNPVHLAALAFISPDQPGQVTTASVPLTEAGDQFSEWIRFCWAVQRSGKYEDLVDTLFAETLKWLEDLSHEVKDKANNYPQNTIAGYVWVNGCAIRTWCDPFVELFEIRHDLIKKAKALLCKSRLTASIMGHYPQTMGPDMIAVARAYEIIGETEIPRHFYKAIINDFKKFTDEIKRSRILSLATI